MVDARAVHLLRLGHGDDISELRVFQETPEAGVLSVGGIRGAPDDGQWGVQGATNHVAGEVALGGEGALVGDAGCSAAFPALRPGLGQVALAVDQGVAAGGGVGGEDADLAILGAAGRAGVLALHSGGGGALLHEAGVVENQHTVWTAELFGHVGLQVVAQAVGVPAAVGEQMLQTVRDVVAGVLGELPAVLAADRTEQPTDVVPHPPTWLHPREAGSGP